MQMEKQIFDNNFVDTELLKKILIKKKCCSPLNHYDSIRDFDGTSKATTNFYEWDLDVYFEDLEYKTSKILWHILSIHENVRSIGDVFNIRANMMTNTNLWILTVLTVIIWIMTMISGIYGMNIDLPLQNYPWAFLILMGFMLIMATWTTFDFQKKNDFNCFSSLTCVQKKEKIRLGLLPLFLLIILWLIFRVSYHAPICFDNSVIEIGNEIPLAKFYAHLGSSQTMVKLRLRNHKALVPLLQEWNYSPNWCYGKRELFTLISQWPQKDLLV